MINLKEEHYQLIQLLIKRKYPNIQFKNNNEWYKFWTAYISDNHWNNYYKCFLCDKLFNDDDCTNKTMPIHIIDHLKENNLLAFI